MVRYDEIFSEDEISSDKSRCQKYTRDDSMNTREPMRFKGGFVTLENNTWKNITKEDKIFSTCSTKILDTKSRHVKSKFHQTSRNSWTRNHR